MCAIGCPALCVQFNSLRSNFVSPSYWGSIALLGVVITVPFLHRDDILYAPEKQFVFGKLKMKHLLAKYIWEGCAMAHLLAAHFSWWIFRCNELVKCVFYISLMTFHSRSRQKKYEKTDRFSTCVSLILAKATPWYVFVSESKNTGSEKINENLLGFKLQKKCAASFE